MLPIFQPWSSQSLSMKRNGNSIELQVLHLSARFFLYLSLSTNSEQFSKFTDLSELFIPFIETVNVKQK